jgi:hydrogenase maturation protein HypF
MAIAQRQGRRIQVRGTVQGVGFRPWVYRVARQAHVTGRVLNDAAGVTIDAFGTADELGDFCEALAADPPPAARIQQLECADIPSEESAGFTIVAGRRLVAEPEGEPLPRIC